MKIVNRDELLDMDAKTVYQPINLNGELGSLRIKGGPCTSPAASSPTDWYEGYVTPHVTRNTIELTTSMAPEDNYEYDDDMRYLVLDEDDVEHMVARLTGRPVPPGRFVLDYPESQRGGGGPATIGA